MAVIWAGSAWLLGLVLASLQPLQLGHWLLLSAICAGFAFFFRNRSSFRNAFLLLSILFLGSARRSSSQFALSPDHVAFYTDLGHEVQVTGTIIQDPHLLESYTRLTLKADRIWIPALAVQKPVSGEILVLAPPIKQYEFGQRIRVSGLLELPPEDGEFSYRAYLAREGILAWMPDGFIRSLGMGPVNLPARLLHQTRMAAFIEVQRLFPYPEAPLLAGILLGIESHIPDSLLRAYSATGTTHIIAISGFNITILAGLILAVFSRGLGRTRGLIMAGLVIAVYTLFVGADAPVVRAAIMGTLALAARYLGRRTHGLASLSTAAVMMTLITPRALEDVGFQLSFAATLGLILYAEPLNRMAISLLRWAAPGLNGERLGMILGEVLLYTLAAQITTLPIIAYHFHQLSLISLLANALILPLQPLLMIISGLATIAGMVWHPLGLPLAWLAWPFSALSNQVVQSLSTIRGGVLHIGYLQPASLILYYAILFSLTALWTNPWWRGQIETLRPMLGERMRVAASGMLLSMALATLVIWNAVQGQPDGMLHLRVLNVGAGESLLLGTPGGKTVLINGGSRPVQLAVELGQELPYLDREIDWLLIAGTRYNQLAGLRDIVSMTALGQVLSSGTGRTNAYQTVLSRLVETGLPIYHTGVGSRLDLGDGSSLEVLIQGSHGAVYLLVYGNARILLPVGLSPHEIPELLGDQRAGHVTAVLLPDGGNPALNPEELLRHYDPMFFLLSCEVGYCPEEDSWISEALLGDRTLLRTDRHGRINLATNGGELWITTQHAYDPP